MNADKAAGGAAVLTLMAIPSLLICGGLYLSTQALGLPGVLALAGLLTLIPSRDPALAFIGKALGALAVLGVLAWGAT